MERELRIIFINGKAAHFTFREMINLHLRPVSFGLILLSFIVFHWAVPMPQAGAMAPVFKTVLWAVLILVMFATYYLLVWLLRGRAIINSLVFGAVAVVLTLTASLLIDAVHQTHLGLGEGVLLAVSVWIVCLLMEMIFVSLNARQLFAQPDGPIPAPPAKPEISTAETPALIVASERFDPGLIRYITSEEHYLRIVLNDGSRHLRGRIADVEAQLPPALGLRVHRSHWVSRAAVQGVERADPSIRLVLTCGTRIPVARGRQGTVRRWLDDAESR
jgi:hypothetical protein